MKKSKEPDKIVEPLEDEIAEPLSWEDEDEDGVGGQRVDAYTYMGPLEALDYFSIRYDPGMDVLRQIAAGQTPEGQRLTRDQMMAMAAKLADGA